MKLTQRIRDALVWKDCLAPFQPLVLQFIQAEVRETVFNIVFIRL